MRGESRMAGTTLLGMQVMGQRDPRVMEQSFALLLPPPNILVAHLTVTFLAFQKRQVLR